MFASVGSRSGRGRALAGAARQRLFTSSAPLLPYTLNLLKVTSAQTFPLPPPVRSAWLEVLITTDSTNLATLTPNIDGRSRVLWAGESMRLFVKDGVWTKDWVSLIPMICSMSQASATTVHNGAGTKLLIDTVDYDNTGLMGDASNKRINIKRTNRYRPSGYGQFNTIPAGLEANFLLANPQVNGSVGWLGGLDGSNHATSSQQGYLNLMFPPISQPVVAGDYVEVYAFQNVGVDVTMYGYLSLAEDCALWL